MPYLRAIMAACIMLHPVAAFDDSLVPDNSGIAALFFALMGSTIDIYIYIYIFTDYISARRHIHQASLQRCMQASGDWSINPNRTEEGCRLGNSTNRRRQRHWDPT